VEVEADGLLGRMFGAGRKDQAEEGSLYKSRRDGGEVIASINDHDSRSEVPVILSVEVAVDMLTRRR
jgi:hypothetical protein